MSQMESGQESSLRGGLDSTGGQSCDPSPGREHSDFQRTATNMARAGLVEVKERAKEAGQSIRERTSDMTTTCSEYISENPFRSVGMAMAAGVVVGMLLFRRSSDGRCD